MRQYEWLGARYQALILLNISAKNAGRFLGLHATYALRAKEFEESTLGHPSHSGLL